MDKITEDRIKTLHPKIREDVSSIVKECNERLAGGKFGIMIRIAEAVRTWAEQDKKYAQGRTAPGPIVTYAKGGDSVHNYGLAVDIVFMFDKNNDGKWEEASWDFFKDHDGDGQIDFEEIDFVFKKYGFVGLYKSDGKRWDFPHFQRTYGYTVAQMKDLFLKGKFIPNTNYINI